MFIVVVTIVYMYLLLSIVIIYFVVNHRCEGNCCVVVRLNFLFSVIYLVNK